VIVAVGNEEIAGRVERNSAGTVESGGGGSPGVAGEADASGAGEGADDPGRAIDEPNTMIRAVCNVKVVLGIDSECGRAIKPRR